jgi:hypothetical protein
MAEIAKNFPDRQLMHVTVLQTAHVQYGKDIVI